MSSLWILGTALLALATAHVSVSDDVLERLREARGDGLIAGTAVVAAGTAERWGEDVPFRLTFDGNGRFHRALGGHRDWTLNFDGTEVWEADGSAGPVVMRGVDWELPLLMTWVATGHWLDPDAPLELSLADDTSVDVTLHGGRMKARVQIDAESLRPTSLTLDAIGLNVGFEDWFEVDDIWLPGNIVTEPSYFGRFTITSALAESTADDLFAKPERPAPGTHWQDGDDTVPVQRMPSGHLMIHPTLDGQDVGWFVLDTGAGMATLSPDVADALGMEAFGSEMIMGVGGPGGTAALRTGATLELGPLQIDDIVWNQSAGHLARMDGMVEETIVGVLGWDLLARAAVQLDPEASTLTLRPPGGFEVPADESVELFIEWRVPNVEVRYEGDRSGILMIDTGAGSFGAFFMSAWVQRLGLLEGRETEPAEGRGIGGNITVEVGTLNWIEVAGHRIENPRVGFSTGEDFEDDPYYQGVLGNPVLGQFRLTLDFQRGLLGLEPL
jgi:predicted aspartyl protease